MVKVLRDWMHRYFSDEQAVVLAVLLILGFAAVLTLGGMLAPVLTGLILAFLMQGLVNAFEHAKDAWAVMPSGLVLSVIVTALAAVAAWTGLSNLRSGGVA